IQSQSSTTACPPTSLNPTIPPRTRDSGNAQSPGLCRLDLEGLQELDEGPLVVVVQRGLLLEAVSAEVVAAIHHKIWALAQFEQRLDEIREHLSRLFVAGVLGQRLEVIFDLEYESHEVSLVTELLGRVLRLQVQVGEQVDWGARGDGADLYAAVTEQPR